MSLVRQGELLSSCVGLHVCCAWCWWVEAFHASLDDHHLLLPATAARRRVGSLPGASHWLRRPQSTRCLCSPLFGALILHMSVAPSLARASCCYRF